MNIRMYGHLRDDHKMYGHLLNNFVLHNEIPILHRSKVIGMMTKKVEK